MASSAASSSAALRARPIVSPDSKRAARVADAIVSDVTARGWPVGELLGSEAELLDRYQVSRAVYREAVRLIEHKRVAHTRRGPGGGLVITEPTVDAVVDAVVLYLYRVGARLDEVLEARIVLEEIAGELAARRLEERDMIALRDFADDADAQSRSDPHALQALVASASRNPALELFVDVLSRVQSLYTSRRHVGPDPGTDASAHARVVEAVIAGDPGLSRRRMRKHVEAQAGNLRRCRSTRQFLPDSVVVVSTAKDGKRAEAVARRITQAVVTDGMRPGQLIGTEPELIDRERVSRSVLREAVRLLEHHQVARMRRGPGGGLFVFEPSASAATDVAAIYLARAGLQLADLAELRSHVEPMLAGLAAEHIDNDGLHAIKDALAFEEQCPSDPEIVRGLHAAVAAATRNRVLQLVAMVAIRISRLHQVKRLAEPAPIEICAKIRRSHVAIAAAVEAGHEELARQRMRRHFDALCVLMR